MTTHILPGVVHQVFWISLVCGVSIILGVIWSIVNTLLDGLSQMRQADSPIDYRMVQRVKAAERRVRQRQDRRARETFPNWPGLQPVKPQPRKKAVWG